MNAPLFNCFAPRPGKPTVIQDWLLLDEGYRAFPYQDCKSLWTVGIGHNLEANPIPLDILRRLSARSPVAPSFADGIYPRSVSWIRQIGGLGHDEAFILLNHDLDEIRDWLPEYIPQVDERSPARSGALYNMAFNLGPGAFSQFSTFIGLVNQPDWAGAAADLRDTLVFRQLPTRYTRIATALETGEVPEEIE